MKYRQLFGSIFAGILLFTTACTQNTEPPDIYTPQEKIDYSACRDTTFNLKYSTPASLRSLVTCLNGNKDAFGPVKEWVDSLTDPQLEAMVLPLNLYLGGRDLRFTQTLELIGNMNKSGLMQDFYRNFAALTRTGAIQTLIPIGARFLEDPAKPGELDENIRVLNDVFPELLDRGLLTRMLRMGANLSNNEQSKIIAFLLSRDWSFAPMNSDNIVDVLLNVTRTATENRQEGAAIVSVRTSDFQRLLIGSTDPGAFRAFNSLTDEDVKMAAALTDALGQGSSIGESNRIDDLSVLVEKTDRPLRCFDNGKAAQVMENAFDMIVKESILRRKEAGGMLDRFMLIEAPVLLASTVGSCDLDPEVPKRHSTMTKLAAKGLTLPLISTVESFLNQNRLELFKGALKSVSIRGTGPILEAMGTRKALYSALTMARKELRADEQKQIAEAVALLFGNQIRGGALNAWVTQNVSKDSQPEIFAALGTLTANRKTLADLITAVDTKGSDGAVRALREAVAQTHLPATGGTALGNLIHKLTMTPETMTPEMKQEFRALARALVASWAEKESGWGYLLGAVAEAESAAHESPIQDFLRDAIQDKQVLEQLPPVLIQVLKDNQGKMKRAVTFLGQMAADGELERMVNFLVELSNESSHGNKTLTEGSEGYKLRREAVNEDIADQIPVYTPVVPPGNFADCLLIDGDLLKPDGKNVYYALRCLDARNGVPALTKLAETLDKSGLLTELVSVLSRKLLSNKYMFQSIEDLKQLQASGDLNSILELLRISLDDFYNLPGKADVALSGLVLDPSFEKTLQSIGATLAAKDSDKGILTLVDLATVEKVTPIYHINDAYYLPVTNKPELMSQARQLFPDKNESQLKMEVDAAADEFSMRPESYYTRPGYYPDLTRAETVAELEQAVGLLLRDNEETGDKRKTDVQQLFTALGELAAWNKPDDTGHRKINFYEFMRWGAMDEHKVIRYWVGENDDPEIRVVTPTDQLDLLVLNSDTSMLPWVPILGVEHAGLFFQVNIAKSKNLKDTLHTMREKLELGMKIKFLMPKLTQNRLRNMVENFDVLERANERGHLVVFQRLYQAFRDATPKGDQDSEDPAKNHMHWVHNPVLKWGFMSRLVLPFASMHGQGQLERFTRDYLESSRAGMDPADAELARDVLSKLLGTYGGKTHFAYFLDALLTLSDNKTAFREVKRTMFHEVLGAATLKMRYAGLFQVFQLLEEEPALFREAIDEALAFISQPNNRVYRMMVQSARLNEEKAAPVRELLRVMGTPGQPGLLPASETYMKANAGLVIRMIKHNRQAFSNLKSSFYEYKEDPAVVALQPQEMIKRLFVNYQGSREVIKDMFNDPVDRKSMIRVVDIVVQNGLVERVSRDVVDVYQAGDIDRIIDFLATYMKPVHY